MGDGSDNCHAQMIISRKVIAGQTRRLADFVACFCFERRAGAGVANSSANTSATQSTHARMRADK